MNRLLRRGNAVEVRAKALLLLYEGNVVNAELKICKEIKSGSKPFIAPASETCWT